jgi:hypothetical protein
MAEPKQKSLEIPSFLRRYLPDFITPMWVEANRWRSVVRNEPTAIICRDRLIVYAQALPWDIRAKESKDEKKLDKDIRYYKNFVLRDFDTIIDLLWQDALDLPVGGNTEIVRWPENVLPTIEHDGETYQVTQPHPKGHVYKIVNIDGATIIPTYDKDFPVMQKIQGDIKNTVYFTRNEIARVVLTPRPEIRIKGYGMPPPQRIYMAISLLYYGNQYYAKLLLDTPEAGILDLLDMSQKDAHEWVDSYQTLLQGVDPLKIGVLYQHTNAAKWIPFGRPPSEMMYDSVTAKYGRIVAAGYWLTLQDIGLDPSGKTLAGEIRRQRESRLTGFGMIREKTKNYVNNDVLPPYLEFDWIERDDEAMAATGRARLLNAQALKAMVEGGLIQPEDGQAQLKKDGLLTIELMEKKDAPPALPQPQAPQNGNAGAREDEDQTDNELKRVPPSTGGRGDVGQTQRAALGDPAISAVEPGSSNFDRLGLVFKKAFDDILKRMGDIQLRRLIRASLKSQFPISSKAIINLSEADRGQWAAERIKAWFGEASIFDDIPQVQKVDQATLDELERLLEKDKWWELPPETQAQVLETLILAFSEGATVAAELVQQFLYEEGLVNSPDLIGLNFDLKNPVTIAELDAKAAELVRHVNKGTKFYLKRIITAGVDEGVSSQEIALRIQEGQGLDQILRESELVAKVTNRARQEIEGLSEKRIMSIVNTEINRAESEGRLAQWTKQNLTTKAWKHTGQDTPCKVCVSNIDQGLVPMDHKFNSVFGEATVQTPPGHPNTCHCHLEFDEAELIKRAGELNAWNGD